MDSNNIISRFRQLQSQRKTLDTKLQEINRYITPGRGEFFSDMMSEHEVDWDHSDIYDSTAVVSCNLLASQMHGNLTSPVTKWFSLQFRDDDTNNDASAKEWLEECEEIVWQALLESDFNNTASELYTDIVSYGTAIVMLEQKNDLEWDGIDFTALPIMDSYFEMSPDGVPYRVYRRIRYTRLELEERFDLPEDIDLNGEVEGSVDAKIEVVFCVYWRNKEIDVNKLLKPEDRPVGYKYVLLNSKIELEEGGYYQFPGMVVRWTKTAGSKWGTSPSLNMLPDIKQLNELVYQTSEARAKAIDPPYKTTERGVIGDLDLSAGGITVLTEMDDLQPMLPGSDFTQADIERERLQQAIRAGYYLDKLEFKDSPAMTATEVNMRYERMLRLMSPTLGRLQSDFLDPLIENVFLLLMRQGQLPEQPESIADSEMDIEYIGAMPRAQKAEVAQGIERWLNGIASLAEVYPSMMDIPDTDQAVRTMAELLGVPAKVLRPEAEVKEDREARAEQQKAMQELQAVEQAGTAMKAVGEGQQAVEQTQEGGMMQ